jgi:hypothetical protein
MNIKKKASTGNGARYMKVIFTVIFFILTAGIYIYNNFAVFNVRVFETKKIVFQKLVKKNDVITLDYVHSVTEQPVYEDFYVKDNSTLAMKEMRYDSFGANLPVGPEKLKNEETKFIVEENCYKILYENRTFDIVPLRVGQVIADHTFIFKDKSKLRLLDIVDGGEYVEFYVKPLLVSLFDRKEVGR